MSTPAKRTGYRSDIDGLRAIAVLSVIVYHVWHDVLPGGFLGVDVFFVISGYLISLHILGEIYAGDFTLSEFYRRRIKRIIPAMLLVTAITVIAAQVFMRPEDAERVAESGLATVFSAANIYFWLYQDTGYFAAASNQLPLLHMWSLGIEEQFYILWPLLLMLSARRLPPVILAAFVFALSFISFWYAEVSFGRDAAFAYYALPARAGELLIGALASIVVLFVRPNNQWHRLANAVVLPSIIVLMASLVVVDSDRVFPGFIAAVPTIATALLILAGHFGDSRLQDILRLPVLVWIGGVSYSAYLVHWPLLAFMRYSGIELGLRTGLIAIAATLLLAFLSCKYIEQPFRRSRDSLLAIALKQFVVPGGVLAIIALVSMKLDGYSGKLIFDNYTERLEGLRAEARPAFFHDFVCQRSRLESAVLQRPECVIGSDQTDSPVILLTGDSIASQYIGMLDVFAQEGNYRIRNIQAGACPPLFATDPAPVIEAHRVEDCRYSLSVIRDALPNFDTVVISAAWSYYDGRDSGYFDAFNEGVRLLVQQGKQVILVARPQVFKHYDRLCREKALALPYMDCSFRDEPLSIDVQKANARLADIAATYPSVEFYDPLPFLCPLGRCSVDAGTGIPQYYDRSHLTIEGSRRLGESIVRGEGVPPVFSLGDRKSRSARSPLVDE